MRWIDVDSADRRRWRPLSLIVLVVIVVVVIAATSSPGAHASGPPTGDGRGLPEPNPASAY
ncbi:MAG: hypothetical protein ACXVHL_34785 [Solirubrobacteraceae bacterium]